MDGCCEVVVHSRGAMVVGGCEARMVVVVNSIVVVVVVVVGEKGEVDEEEGVGTKSVA